MLVEPMMEKLYAMKLNGIAVALEEQRKDPTITSSWPTIMAVALSRPESLVPRIKPRSKPVCSSQNGGSWRFYANKSFSVWPS